MRDETPSFIQACATPTRNVPNSSSRRQAAPRFLRRMCPRMASKDPGAKSQPWSSLHPDSVLAASRLDLQELLRPTKWTAQANGVALMHRQTLICPQLPWIHLRQPCERPDLASVRPDLTSVPHRTARHPLLRLLSGVLAAAVQLLLPNTLAADPRCSRALSFLHAARSSFVIGASYRWHEYMVRADSLDYLREKLRVTNPFSTRSPATISTRLRWSAGSGAHAAAARPAVCVGSCCGGLWRDGARRTVPAPFVPSTASSAPGTALEGGTARRRLRAAALALLDALSERPAVLFAALPSDERHHLYSPSSRVVSSTQTLGCSDG